MVADLVDLPNLRDDRLPRKLPRNPPIKNQPRKKHQLRSIVEVEVVVNKLRKRPQSESLQPVVAEVAVATPLRRTIRATALTATIRAQVAAAAVTVMIRTPIPVTTGAVIPDLPSPGAAADASFSSVAL